MLILRTSVRTSTDYFLKRLTQFRTNIPQSFHRQQRAFCYATPDCVCASTVRSEPICPHRRQASTQVPQQP
jgi:hypothetical protein